MASSANIGRVLWPKKAKTNEINEMVTKNPSSGFELSRMIILLAPSPHKMGNTIICVWPLNLIQIKKTSSHRYGSAQ
jgi:hypothetical protein